VGGSSDNSDWLYGYFTVITVLGLGIDTIRRWAWVSVLTMVLAYATGWLLSTVSSAPPFLPFSLYVTGLALLAIAIPARSIWPDQLGPMISETIASGETKTGFAGWPGFPTLLAAGSLLVTVLSLLPSVSSYQDFISQGGTQTFLASNGTEAFWASIFLLTFLSVAMIVWAKGARALQDLTLVPAVGLLLLATLLAPWQIIRNFHETRPPEVSTPWDISLLIAVGLVISALAAWRSKEQGPYRIYWAAGAVLFAPLMAIALEVPWYPARTLGTSPWALHVMAIAALMVVLAERFAKADGPENRLRMSLATLSALSSIAFACFITLGASALTLALGAMVAIAAWLDRRFDLRQMSFFIAAGVVAVGYRLIADPGLGWATGAPIAEMVLVYGGTLAFFVAALWLLQTRDRENARIMLDSAAWSVGGTLLSLLLYRAIVAMGGAREIDSHWSLALMALIWLGVGLAQLQRMPIGGRLRLVRAGLSIVFLGISALAMLAAATLANPVLFPREIVLGPVLFNTLTVAYLLPAVLLALGAWRLGTLAPAIRLGFVSVAGLLGVLWVFLSVRHFWQGSQGMASGTVSQGELYSYTIVLLLAGAALFYQSLARNSSQLRRAGLAVIAIAVAKVFFFDMSGLGGLTRVFSFLVLGLSLAALAWLDRWAQLKIQTKPDAPLP